MGALVPDVQLIHVVAHVVHRRGVGNSLLGFSLSLLGFRQHCSTLVSHLLRLCEPLLLGLLSQLDCITIQ